MKTYICFVIFAILLIRTNTYCQQDSISTDTAKAPVLAVVEIMPTFIGGEQKMYEWLWSNIVYPQAAKDSSISGMVVISFIVEKDGSITNASIIKDIGGGCGAEAQRVVSIMPKWNPGRRDGVPVRVQYYLPARFFLN
jgi:periplasmic protein TonB